jgi:hypothetical protein
MPNCCEPKAIQSRHNSLAKEMERRKYNHKSDLVLSCDMDGEVDSKKSLKDLISRCKKCERRKNDSKYL